MKQIILFTLVVCACALTAAKSWHFSPARAVMITNTLALDDYVGTYTFTTSGSPVSNFHVRHKEGALFGEADNLGENKLLEQAEADTFKSTSSYGSTIVFLRNAQTKKVTGLQLIIQGNTLEATRND
jgi:hypothetical protein